MTRGPLRVMNYLSHSNPLPNVGWKKGSKEAYQREMAEKIERCLKGESLPSMMPTCDFFKGKDKAAVFDKCNGEMPFVTGKCAFEDSGNIFKQIRMYKSYDNVPKAIEDIFDEVQQKLAQTDILPRPLLLLGILNMASLLYGNDNPAQDGPRIENTPKFLGYFCANVKYTLQCGNGAFADLLLFEKRCYEHDQSTWGEAAEIPALDNEAEA
ncbi:hypothetical protein PG997_007494 [Apiospora hydei]|uniref:Uncharacterized protein n=1 Tax=Apiospora hydei TaxID=1337664 RepID=A0ABR1W870_9PEZI